jgi:hypothetical protein
MLASHGRLLWLWLWLLILLCSDPSPVLLPSIDSYWTSSLNIQVFLCSYMELIYESGKVCHAAEELDELKTEAVTLATIADLIDDVRTAVQLKDFHQM